VINTWVESRCEPDSRHDAWVSAGRQWLAELGQGLGEWYEPVECDHFLGLTSEPDAIGRPLLQFAEECRAALLSLFDGVANFEGLGKHVVVALRNLDDYYRYISLYYPEGEHGGTSGVHIRAGYPHVALHGTQLWMLRNTLAHELTHVSLHHLSMPQWLEEGLAQMVEHDMTGRSLLVVEAEMAGRHKRYWGRHGLDVFWRGEGFHRPGKVQELSYQLAEILVRLLVEQGRPRWLGWVREPQRRFFAFLQGANVSDCGEGACKEHQPVMWFKGGANPSLVPATGPGVSRFQGITSSLLRSG
jgi:hypothetical protein